MGSFYPEAEVISFTVAWNIYNSVSGLVFQLLRIDQVFEFAAEMLEFPTNLCACLVFRTFRSKSYSSPMRHCNISLSPEPHFFAGFTECPHPHILIILWAKMQTPATPHRRS